MTTVYGINSFINFVGVSPISVSLTCSGLYVRYSSSVSLHHFYALMPARRARLGVVEQNLLQAHFCCIGGNPEKRQKFRCQCRPEPKLMIYALSACFGGMLEAGWPHQQPGFMAEPGRVVGGGSAAVGW